MGDSSADSYFTRPVETALTVVAQYEALSASIVFKSDRDSAVETLTGVTDGVVDAALPTPVREGYTFAGWYDNKDFEGRFSVLIVVYFRENVNHKPEK